MAPNAAEYAKCLCSLRDALLAASAFGDYVLMKFSVQGETASETSSETAQRNS